MPCKKVLSGKRVTMSSIIVHTTPIHLIRLTIEDSVLFFIKAVKNAWRGNTTLQEYDQRLLSYYIIKIQTFQPTRVCKWTN